YFTSRHAAFRQSAGAPQGAREQVPPAFARDEIDIADKLCAVLAPLQRDLAAMETFHLSSMRDAYDGDLRERVDPRLHHPLLALRIECRRRFIQHDDVGAVQ